VVPDTMDALEWLRKHLDADGSDLLREMVRTFAERLMAAEVEVLCNAGYGEVTPERSNRRNGYRARQRARSLRSRDRHGLAPAWRLFGTPAVRSRQLRPMPGWAR
jgi:hypothetical protein